MGTNATGFDLRFEVSGPSEDGTFLALCREMPIIVAATSEPELRERMATAVNEVVSKLDALGPGEDVKFLQDAGVELRATPVDGRARLVTFPVTLSVAAG